MNTIKSSINSETNAILIQVFNDESVMIKSYEFPVHSDLTEIAEDELFPGVLQVLRTLAVHWDTIPKPASKETIYDLGAKPV